jgi:hypothetical protein
MLQNIYKEQLIVAGHARTGQAQKLFKYDATYATTFQAIKKRLLHKGARDTTVDPQRNTIKDTYDLEDLEKIAASMFELGTIAGDRALAMSMWSHGSVGRGDDVRLFYLADLVKPSLIPAVGEPTVVACRQLADQSSNSRVCRAFASLSNAAGLPAPCSSLLLQLCWCLGK